MRNLSIADNSLSINIEAAKIMDLFERNGYEILENDNWKSIRYMCAKKEGIGIYIEVGENSLINPDDSDNEEGEE